MNRISHSPLCSVSAEPPPATDAFEHNIPWAGLAAASRDVGVILDDLALARFARYRELLLERNSRVNLTAVRDPIEVERKLFLDALAMIPAIKRFFEVRPPSPSASTRLIDVGSGAGFPGLVLKIARPELDVTLLDATAKKVAFVNDVIADLSLVDVRAVHGRAEEFARDPGYRERYDLATARAVASLPVLLELVMPFLDVGGEALFPKGPQLDKELQAGRRAAAKLSSQIIAADRLFAGETRLVIARKQTLTAKAYPRRTGVPARMPLGGGA